MAFPRQYISHNQIRTFLDCAYKYYLAYIREILVPCNEKVYLGNIFHASIERYFQTRLNGRQMELEELTEIFRQKFRDEQKTSQIIWTEKESITEKRGISFIHYFVKQIGPQIKPLMIEKELEVQIPGSALRLKGIIDLVEEDYTIIDFKTSTTRWSESKARNSLQFTIYKYLFEQSFSVQNPLIRVEQLYNSNGKSTRHRSICFTISADRIEAFLKRLNAIIELISASNFLPNSGYACKWCDYREHCDQKAT